MSAGQPVFIECVLVFMGVKPPTNWSLGFVNPIASDFPDAWTALCSARYRMRRLGRGGIPSCVSPPTTGERASRASGGGETLPLGPCPRHCSAVLPSAALL
jgi:hypothetical protein